MKRSTMSMRAAACRFLRTMMQVTVLATVQCFGLTGPAMAVDANPQAAASPMMAPTEQVRATERAFAQSMADRNHAKFAEFISAEAIFFTASEPYRGKQQVVDGWQRFFQAKDAPFSWQPDKVEVLASGNLALSTGPVYDPSGQLIAHFTSIWRQEAPGVWRIIFDKGESVSPPQPKPDTPAAKPVAAAPSGSTPASGSASASGSAPARQP